jgi:two-component system cell cycle response regulator DivK
MNHTPTVLYVEDNPGNRMLIRRILQSQEYNVLEAGNAREAFQVVNSTHPDLILMDMSMPDVDGFTLTKKFRKLPGFQEVPIIALTANVMQGDREKTFQAGCDGYIEKPIDVDLFITQVNLLLEQRVHHEN